MQQRDRIDQANLTRRGLLVTAIAAGLALGLPVMRTLAQETNGGSTAAKVPAGAVAWVKFNLNSATSEHLSGIPGAGERMTREFLEYRPYASIMQFRGEIGKYITPEEVAALERYIFVPVDPNQADADTLQQLPGVTADLAQTLIAARPYDSTPAFLTALTASVNAELVSAAAAFLAPDAAATAIWLKYNLNTASNEQLLGIPGAGERMTREFVEYRPYSSIAQFRGEMGKYISPEEVAGFEKYLFVPVEPGQADAATLEQLPGVNADIAQKLASQGPYTSSEALQAALQTTLTPELAAVATTYLVGA